MLLICIFLGVTLGGALFERHAQSNSGLLRQHPNVVPLYLSLIALDSLRHFAWLSGPSRHHPHHYSVRVIVRDSRALAQELAAWHDCACVLRYLCGISISVYALEIAARPQDDHLMCLEAAAKVKVQLARTPTADGSQATRTGLLRHFPLIDRAFTRQVCFLGCSGCRVTRSLRSIPVKQTELLRSSTQCCTAPL